MVSQRKDSSCANWLRNDEILRKGSDDRVSRCAVRKPCKVSFVSAFLEDLPSALPGVYDLRQTPL